MGSGDPMLQTKFRTAALASSAVFVLALTGCGAKQPADTSSALREPAPPPPVEKSELLGAPPAAQAPPADGLLGGPIAQPKPVAVSSSDDSRLKTWRRPDGTLVTAMRPIANPGSSARHGKPAPRPPVRPHAKPHHARPAPAAVARPAQIAAKPAPKPAPKPAVAVIKPAPKPAVVAAKPAPAPALKPVAPPAKPAQLAKAPTPVIAPAAPAAGPKLSPKVEKLQAAVAPAATSGAVLATAESLKTGKEGQVTLSLPATLGDMIKEQAAKLGIGKPAKKVSAYADLEGQGYEITPNGRQTATVKPGEPTTFAWQVKPTPEAKGSLSTKFGASLDGAKPAQPFSLGSISKQVAAVPEKAKEAAAGFKMPAFLDQQYDVPGVGKVAGKSLLGAGLVLLALLILVAISRNAAKAKAQAERRRKFRTLNDYGRNELDNEFDTPKSQDVAYVNPMVAAAGGAVAGAAATAMFNHHQEAKAEEAAAQATEHEPFPAPADDSPQVQHVSESAHVEPSAQPVAHAEPAAEEPQREPEPAH